MVACDASHKCPRTIPFLSKNVREGRGNSAPEDATLARCAAASSQAPVRRIMLPCILLTVVDTWFVVFGKEQDGLTAESLAPIEDVKAKKFSYLKIMVEPSRRSHLMELKRLDRSNEFTFIKGPLQVIGEAKIARPRKPLRSLFFHVHFNPYRLRIRVFQGVMVSKIDKKWHPRPNCSATVRNGHCYEKPDSCFGLNFYSLGVDI